MKDYDPTDDYDTDLEVADELSNKIITGCIIMGIIFIFLGIGSCAMFFYNLIP